MRNFSKSQDTQYSWLRVIAVKILPHVSMKIENQAFKPSMKKKRNSGITKIHTPRK